MWFFMIVELKNLNPWATVAQRHLETRNNLCAKATNVSMIYSRLNGVTEFRTRMFNLKNMVDWLLNL